MSQTQSDKTNQTHVSEEAHEHSHDCHDCGSHQPIQRSTPKVGRNDPCPCNSGKKYKKCCLPLA